MRYVSMMMAFLVGAFLGDIALTQEVSGFSPVPGSQSGLEQILESAPSTMETLLDPSEAFIASVDASGSDRLIAHWDIVDGYYLYRKRFQFAVELPGLELGEPQFPAGEWQEDEFFGEVEIYRHRVAVIIPLIWSAQHEHSAMLELQVLSQGCADVGVCFPPRRETIPVVLSGGGDGSG